MPGLVADLSPSGHVPDLEFAALVAVGQAPAQEANVCPSGLKATDQTRAVWPSGRRGCRPVARPQMRTVLSWQAVASASPPGAKATDKTGPG